MNWIASLILQALTIVTLGLLAWRGIVPGDVVVALLSAYVGAQTHAQASAFAFRRAARQKSNVQETAERWEKENPAHATLLRASNGALGIVLKGWLCPNAACSVFNGEEKTRRDRCRVCEWARPVSIDEGDKE